MAAADILAALLPENSSLNVTVEREGHPEAFGLSGLTADMLKGGSAAFGLRENDRILEVDGTSVHTANELVYEVMRKGIHPVDLTVRRGEETVVLEDVEFRAVTESGERFGEIDFYVQTEDKTFSNVVKHAFFRSVSSIKMIPETLFDMLTGRYSVKSVSGPVGVTQVMSEAASRSMDELLYIVVVLTMNLGVMNLLPLPALDGGRLVFQLIELIRGKPVPARVEGYVHFAGLVVLMLLMVLILAKDIAALFV